MSRAFCRLQSNPKQAVGPPAKKGLDLAHIHSVRFETDPILYFQFTVLHPLALNMTDWLYPLLYTLLALGAGVLCLPIALSLHYRRDDLPTNWHLLVQLAFFRGGLGIGFQLAPEGRTLMPVLLGRALPFPVLTLGTEPTTKKKKPKRAKKATPKADKLAAEKKKSAPLDLIRLVLRPALSLLASLPRTFGLKKLRITGRLGFADPAKTGIVNGYLQAVKTLKNKFLSININPDFTRPGAFGQVDLVAHFHLGLLLLFLGRFGLQVVFRFLASRLFGWKLGLI